MWLYFALLTPLLFAIVHVLDSHCVEDIFDSPWIGVVTSALSSLVIFVPLPYFAYFIDWEIPSIQILLLALIAGALIQFSQFFYFQALAYSEAGIVAAYWNMVPALLPLASFIFLSERLSEEKYIGITILIIASVTFCLLDSKIETRWRSFTLMLIAAFMQVGMFLIQDIVFENISYLEGFYLITVGLILAGLSPLLFKRNRQKMTPNGFRLAKNIKLFVGIELVNLAALATSQRAVSLGIPSLVAAVESTIPAYTFVLSAMFLLVFPKMGDAAAIKHLPRKLSLVGVMVLGVLLVS